MLFFGQPKLARPKTSPLSSRPNTLIPLYLCAACCTTHLNLVMSAVASLAQEQHESVNTAPTTTFTLPLVGDDSPPTRTASPTPSFVTQLPLVATGALLEFEQERLTPAIGIQFGKGLQLKEILSRSDATRDAVLRDIALSGMLTCPPPRVPLRPLVDLAPS